MHIDRAQGPHIWCEKTEGPSSNMLKCWAESIFSLQEEKCRKTLLLLFMFFFFLGIKSIIVTNPLHHICFPACIVKKIFFLNHLLIYYLLIFSIFVLSWWWQIVWAWDWRLKVRLSDTGVSWVGWKMQSSAVVSWQVSQWIVVLKHKEENYFGFMQKLLKTRE